MKRIVQIIFLMLTGVGIGVMVPWRSGEPEHLVEELIHDAPSRSPALEPIRSTGAGTSKPSSKETAVAPNTNIGTGGRAVQFVTPPPRPVAPSAKAGSASGTRGTTVTGWDDDDDQSEQIPSAVYAVDDAPFVGAGYSGGMAREISIPVPEGAKVPAVFFDGADKPVAQQKALDRIAEEFEQNVAEVPAGLTKEKVWESARAIADERYITLFGYQAFNQYHLQAAKEALKEKRAAQAIVEAPKE